jgi:GNAT superfamily N-acetyltransferase
VAFSVYPVQNKKDLQTFVRLPYRLYRGDSVWIPPLRAEEKKKFSVKGNPMFAHCDFQHFLLAHNGKTVGRVSAFIDRLALDHWKQPVGLFGSYECIDNAEGAGLLLETAKNWLRDKGMERMRGPWSYESQEWGLLVKGYERPPMMMAPYNPPYYDSQMAFFGLKKIKDLLAYEVDVRNGYDLPPRFLKMTEYVAKKYRITIRPVNMKNLEEDVKTIMHVANSSTENNWGYVPVTDEEAQNIAKALKPIVDPDIVMIAEVENKPIGYLIAFPDVNVLIRGLNGHLFPFGIFKLLFGFKKIRQYRIWALGVIPEYQRRAIDTLFYKRLCDVLLPRNPTVIEANYVLEDNMIMNNPILKMGFQEVKRYRVYECEM